MMIGELEDDIHIEIEDELFEVSDFLEVMLEEGVMAKKKKKFMEWNYLFRKNVIKNQGIISRLMIPLMQLIQDLYKSR